MSNEYFTDTVLVCIMLPGRIWCKNLTYLQNCLILKSVIQVLVGLLSMANRNCDVRFLTVI